MTFKIRMSHWMVCYGFGRTIIRHMDGTYSRDVTELLPRMGAIKAALPKAQDAARPRPKRYEVDPDHPLLHFVVERALDAWPTDDPQCPVCSGRSVRVSPGGETLLGWDTYLGPDADPNHHWDSFTCRDCGAHGGREWKQGRVWYTTEEAELIAGLPTCFESYIYHHRGCGGAVTRTHRNLDGTPTNVLRYHDGVEMFKTFYTCARCGAEIETNDRRPYQWIK